MSNIDDVIDTLDLRPHGDIVSGMIERSRAELAQLRAELATAQATVKAQAAIIKEQEQQIEYITLREATIKDNYETAALNQAAQLDQARAMSKRWKYACKFHRHFHYEYRKMSDTLRKMNVRIMNAATAPARDEAQA
jgi:multidrug efflux pump subunit AcrA (membrane-fusion protein)